MVLDDLVINTAEALLKYPSIFSKVCAHELAARRSEAYELENQGKFSEAFDLWLSIDQDTPGDQTSLLKRVHLAHIQGDRQQALKLVRDALQANQKQSTLTYLGELRLQEWLIDLERPKGIIIQGGITPQSDTLHTVGRLRCKKEHYY